MTRDLAFFANSESCAGLLHGVYGKMKSDGTMQVDSKLLRIYLMSLTPQLTSEPSDFEIVKVKGEAYAALQATLLYQSYQRWMQAYDVRIPYAGALSAALSAEKASVTQHVMEILRELGFDDQPKHVDIQISSRVQFERDARLGDENDNFCEAREALKGACEARICDSVDETSRQILPDVIDLSQDAVDGQFEILVRMPVYGDEAIRRHIVEQAGPAMARSGLLSGPQSDAVILSYRVNEAATPQLRE